MMALSLAVSALALVPAAASSAVAPVQIPVELTLRSPAPVSGRLIIFAARAKANDQIPELIDANPFAGTSTAVAAREIKSLSPNQVATIDTETDVVPTPWSKLPPGRYHVQAVLDVDHNYNNAGRGAGDIVSKVTDMTLPGAVRTLQLSEILPARDPFAAHDERQRATVAYLPKVVAIDYVSPSLSAFWGRPIHMRGWIALPPDYDGNTAKTWPTVFQTHGFGGNSDTSRWSAASYARLMAQRDIPPMIWVALDESSPTGTHEFADSVNNGPWGTALTTELIPWLEGHYKMDSRPSGRLLTGHSSGGWSTLWLQTNYPKIFGGTWSTSPDPSDFHDFTGADIYRANANVYAAPDGRPIPLVRMDGKDVANFKDFAQLEDVLGPVGGQMASFEWVFSPRGSDGRPMQLFDRRTGAVNRAVAEYWRAHYDIVYRLERNWAALKNDLDGKIHVIVGTADTFHLDGPARKLAAALQQLGAKADVRFLSGKTHMNLYEANGDPDALTKQIAREMYAGARPAA